MFFLGRPHVVVSVEQRRLRAIWISATGVAHPGIPLYIEILFQALLQVGLRSIQDKAVWTLHKDLCFYNWLRNAASPTFLRHETGLVLFQRHLTPRADTCTSWWGSIHALRVLIHGYNAKHNTTSSGMGSSLSTIMSILKAWGPACPCNSWCRIAQSMSLGTVYSSLVLLSLAMAWVFVPMLFCRCLELYRMLPDKSQVPHKKFVTTV